MSERIPQSTAVRLAFKAFLSTDGGTEATGKTIAITIAKNATGPFGNPNAGATNAIEVASGWYYVDLVAADTGTLGPLLVRGAGTGIDDVGLAPRVVSANNAGFAGVPDVAAGANGGLPTGDDAGAVALTATERNNVADAMLDRDMSIGTDSGSTTVRTVRQALRVSRNKVSITSGTMTVTKEDDVTTSHTAAVTTDATAAAIVSIDPAGP